MWFDLIVIWEWLGILLIKGYIYNGSTFESNVYYHDYYSCNCSYCHDFWIDLVTYLCIRTYKSHSLYLMFVSLKKKKKKNSTWDVVSSNKVINIVRVCPFPILKTKSIGIIDFFFLCKSFVLAIHRKLQFALHKAWD